MVHTYQNFRLPSLICDTKFLLYWANTEAKRQFPQFATPDSVQTLLAELDIPAIQEQIEATGNYTIAELLVPTSTSISISPLYSAQQELMGYIFLFFSEKDLASPPNALSTTNGLLGHEIRSTLQKVFQIEDNLALKADYYNAPWVNEYINEVTIHHYYILRVAQNLSYYSRFQNKQIIPHFTSFALLDWMEDIAPTVAEMGRLAGVEVDFLLPEKDIYAVLDQEFFELALFHLLHNSFSYSLPKGRVQVSLTEDAEQMHLTVRDNGVGIDEAVQPQLTKPYYSLAVNGKKAGVGLGLTLVDQVAKMHKGKLQVESDPGRSTTVTLSLPMYQPGATLLFAQEEPASSVRDRFSQLYVGLASTTLPNFT